MFHQLQLHLPLHKQRVLPEKAERIYKKAFDRAYIKLGGSERHPSKSEFEVEAHKRSWQEVKKAYRKNDDIMWDQAP